MIKVDNLEASVLSQARGESRLSSGQRAEKWAAIETRLLHGELPVVDVPAPENGLLGAATPLHTLIIGLALGGVVGLGVGVFQNAKPPEPPQTALSPAPEPREVIPPRLPEELPKLKPSSAQETDAGVRAPVIGRAPTSLTSADKAIDPSLPGDASKAKNLPPKFVAQRHPPKAFCNEDPAQSCGALYLDTVYQYRNSPQTDSSIVAF